MTIILIRNPQNSIGNYLGPDFTSDGMVHDRLNMSASGSTDGVWKVLDSGVFVLPAWAGLRTV